MPRPREKLRPMSARIAPARCYEALCSPVFKASSETTSGPSPGKRTEPGTDVAYLRHAHSRARKPDMLARLGWTVPLNCPTIQAMLYSSQCLRAVSNERPIIPVSFSHQRRRIADAALTYGLRASVPESQAICECLRPFEAMRGVCAIWHDLRNVYVDTLNSWSVSRDSHAVIPRV